jgi:hypothetical protein
MESKDPAFGEFGYLHAQVLELGHQKMIVHFLSRHREGYQVAHHSAVDLDPVLTRQLLDHTFHLLKRNENHLLLVRALDLLLQVTSVPANQVHKLLVSRRVSEFRNGPFLDWNAGLLISRGAKSSLIL